MCETAVGAQQPADNTVSSHLKLSGIQIYSVHLQPWDDLTFEPEEGSIVDTYLEDIVERIGAGYMCILTVLLKSFHSFGYIRDFTDGVLLGFHFN